MLCGTTPIPSDWNCTTKPQYHMKSKLNYYLLNNVPWHNPNPKELELHHRTTAPNDINPKYHYKITKQVH